MPADSIKGIDVLLVEDNPGDRDLVREYLEIAGNPLKAETAGSLSEALEKLDQWNFSVVLLDLGLPDCNGLETLMRIKSREPPVPVVVLTGLEDEQTGIEAVRNGAQDYLVKGHVNAHLLSRALRYAIERYVLQNELQALRAKQEINGYQKIQESCQESSEDREPATIRIEGEVFSRFVELYSNLVISYVRSVRLQNPRPSGDIRVLAGRLAELLAGAKDVVRLHLAVIEEVTRKARRSDEQSIAHDARLVLVELLGHLLDVYRYRAWSGNHTED